MIESISSTLIETQDNAAIFIIESFLYLEVVSKNMTLRLDAPSRESRSPETRQSYLLPFFASWATASCRSYFIGYGHDLFDLIPQINQFAKKPAGASPRCRDEQLLNDFYHFENLIITWEPHTFAMGVLDSPSDTLNDDLLTAGVLYQMALLVYLRLALNGPGWPQITMNEEIQWAVNEALTLFDSLSPQSPSWSSLLWPFLIIGSCIQSPEKQESLVSTLMRSNDLMPCCGRVMNLLMWLWSEPDVDGTFFGPFGIDAIMEKRGIKLCLG